MTVRLQVAHMGPSSLAGTRSSHAHGPVRAGRAPGNDILFEPQKDRLVSGRHLELNVSSDGSVTATDLGSSNGTLLDGATLRGTAVVAPGARLELGRGGPVLVAWMGADDDPPPAHRGKPRPPAGAGGEAAWRAEPSSQSPPGGAAKPRRSFADRFGREAEPAAQAPGPTPRSPRQPARGSPPPRAPGPAARAPSQAPRPPGGGGRPKSAVGRSTMLDMLGEHRSRVRRTQLVTLLLVIATVGGAVALMLAKDPDTTPPVERVERIVDVVRPSPERPAKSEKHDHDWTRVMETLRERVYLVMTRDADGRESKMGTAWSLDPERGLLATNAHVAEVFTELESGSLMLARSSGDPLVDLYIEKVELHPGYAQFGQDKYQLRPLADTHSGWRILVNPYDVALMHVKRTDAVNQAPGLPLAPKSTLMLLNGGEELAYAGFPLEGQMGGGTDKDRPACNSNRFALSRATGPFFGRAERPEEAHILTYSMIITGGASGSPVVNGEGQVIGLVSAGNFWGRSRGARVMGGGICYGPRADLVAELLDGSAERQANARGERDRAELQRIWNENQPTEKRLLNAGAYHLKYDSSEKSGDVSLIDKKIVRTSITRPAEFEARIPGGGDFGLLFASLDSPAGITVQVGKETTRVGTWYWVLPFSVRSGGKIQTRVRLVPRSADQSTGRVLFVLYRVTR